MFSRKFGSHDKIPMEQRMDDMAWPFQDSLNGDREDFAPDWQPREDETEDAFPGYDGWERQNDFDTQGPRSGAAWREPRRRGATPDNPYRQPEAETRDADDSWEADIPEDHGDEWDLDQNLDYEY